MGVIMKEMKVERLTTSKVDNYFTERTVYYTLYQNTFSLSSNLDPFIGNVLKIQEANFWKDSADGRFYREQITYWPENIKTIKFKVHDDQSVTIEKDFDK